VQLLFLAFACTTSTGDDTASADAPTYHADVAHIMEASCVQCHSAGQVGPFNLDTYESVSVVGASVLDSVVERRMPPFLADSSECLPFEHDPSLTEAEIETISQWVDAGMPEGDPADGPAPWQAEAGLERVDATLEIEEYEANFASAPDDYRCFIVDPGITEDAFVSAYEVAPTNTAIAHHMIVYMPLDDAALADAYALDDAAPGAGYPCFGDAGVDSSMIAPWAPGRQVWSYTEGSGVRVTGGMPLIVQMHYNQGSDDWVDKTVVNFQLEDTVPGGEIIPFFWVNGSLSIPPGEDAHTETDTTSIRRYTGYDGDLELLAIGPHMHSIGTSLHASFTDTDDNETCLVDIPRWDFNWQFAYEYTEPVLLTASDRITLECVFDSSDRDQVTTWGDGTGDEMCLITMFVRTVD
jgi:hypothetical protein